MTLATRLLLLVALALTPPLLSGVLNDVMQRRERQAEMEKSAIAETRSLQDSLALVTNGVHRLLVAMSNDPAIRTGSPAACTSYLKSIVSQFQEFTLLSVIDSEGSVVCSSIGSAPGSYSVADRAYFRRALESKQFSGGDLVTGMLTARRSLHFALPIKGGAGGFQGVVAASIDQDWLAEQLATESAPEGALLVMVDPGGIVIAAARDGVSVVAPWIGRPASPSLLQAMHLRKAEVVELPGPDGRSRLFGAVAPNPALVGNTVIVGLDREQAFADLRAASWRNIIGLAIGAAVALLAGLIGARRFVLGPLRRLAVVADRVGAGDLQARADLGRRTGEIRELGAVFDRMTAALFTREQERDTAEAARLRGAARLRFALEASGQGSFEWDVTPDVVRRSDTVAAMFGFGPNEGLVSADYFDRMVPEDRAPSRQAIQEGLVAGRIMLSFRIALPDGTQRFVASRGEVIRDVKGNPSIVGLIVDETERYDTVSALRESEARFQAIANCIDQMVWSSGPDGRHDYFNQRWYDFTGLAQGSLFGEAWRSLFHPDDRRSTRQLWTESLQSGRPYHQEFRLRHFSGAFRWVLGRAQAIRDEDGRIVRWFGTCTDIDEIVQAREVLARSREALSREVADRTAALSAAEEQLRQSQKMEAVGQLTGGIAHDFNNMLQAIGGSLELLVRRIDQEKLEDAKRFAGIARTTVDRAASLTQRLLAFARRQTLSPEAVDTAGLMDGMSELIARTVGPAIDLSVRHDGGTWPVLCDLSQLENVLLNLCINARDAMGTGGKLSISMRNVSLRGQDVGHIEGGQAGDYVEIAVADSGNGMDEATRARAFEPFFTTKPLGQGTGLGLSQVYGFVRQSGGFVRLESALGEGTTVRLLLPRHAGRVAPPADEAGAGVLLVESDADIRASLAGHLRGFGYAVRESDGSGEVIQMISSGSTPPRLLITGVGLPGNMNGRQVAEAARARWPGLPVLFITGYAGSLAEGELGHGMAAVAAPIDPADLRRRIDALLATPHPA